MATISDFTNAVSKSRLLTRMQKQEFLTHPELFPEAYQARIIKILSTFDHRLRYRDQALKNRLAHAYGQFEQKLTTENIPDEEKHQLLVRVRKQVDTLTAAR